MHVKIEARILTFPGTDFHFPSTSVPPGTFFRLWLNRLVLLQRRPEKLQHALAAEVVNYQLSYDNKEKRQKSPTK